MTFEKQLLPPCPRCGQPAMRVTETRKSPMSLRRRKKCDACSHRLTTHEITHDMFTAFKNDQLIVSKFRKLLDKVIPEVSEEAFRCISCKYNTGQSCDFDLPEYCTEDAHDCNLAA